MREVIGGIKLRLAIILKEKNISLRKLSEMASISASYLSELKNGKYEATESKIIRISLALGITPNELLGWDSIINQLKKNLEVK